MDVWGTHSAWADSDEHIEQENVTSLRPPQFDSDLSNRFHEQLQPWDDNVEHDNFVDNNNDGHGSLGAEERKDGFESVSMGTGWSGQEEDNAKEAPKTLETGFQHTSMPAHMITDAFPRWDVEEESPAVVEEDKKDTVDSSGWEAPSEAPADRKEPQPQQKLKQEVPGWDRDDSFASPWDDQEEDGGWGTAAKDEVWLSDKEKPVPTQGTGTGDNSTDNKNIIESSERLEDETPSDDKEVAATAPTKVEDTQDTQDAVGNLVNDDDGFGDFEDYDNQGEDVKAELDGNGTVSSPGKPDFNSTPIATSPPLSPWQSEVGNRASWASSKGRASLDSVDSHILRARYQAEHIHFDIKPEALKALFPSLKEKEELSPAPDIIASTEARKIWYQLSAGGLDRHGDDGDDVVRVKWAGSKIQSRVHETVSRWITEDQASGRIAIGGGIQGGSFGWSENPDFSSKVDMNAIKRFTSPPRMERQIPPLSPTNDVYDFSRGFGSPKRTKDETGSPNLGDTRGEKLRGSTDMSSQNGSNMTIPMIPSLSWQTPAPPQPAGTQLKSNGFKKPPAARPPLFSSYSQSSAMATTPALKSPPLQTQTSMKNPPPSSKHSRGISTSSFDDDWGSFSTVTESEAPETVSKNAPFSSKATQAPQAPKPTIMPQRPPAKPLTGTDADVWGSFDIFDAKPSQTVAMPAAVNDLESAFGSKPSVSLNTSQQKGTASKFPPNPSINSMANSADADDNFDDWGEMVNSPMLETAPNLALQSPAMGQNTVKNQSNFSAPMSTSSISSINQAKRMSLPPNHNASQSLGSLQDLSLLGDMEGFSSSQSTTTKAPTPPPVTFDSIIQPARRSNSPATTFDSLISPSQDAVPRRSSIGSGLRSVSSPVTHSPLRREFSPTPSQQQPSVVPSAVSNHRQTSSLFELSQPSIKPLSPSASPPPQSSSLHNSISSLPPLQPSLSPKLSSPTLSNFQPSPKLKSYPQTTTTAGPISHTASKSSQDWSIDDFSIFESAVPAAAPSNPSRSSSSTNLKGSVAIVRSLGDEPKSPVPKSPITATPRTRNEIEAEGDAVVNKIVNSLPDLGYMLR